MGKSSINEGFNGVIPSGYDKHSHGKSLNSMKVSCWENHLFLWAIFSMAMLNKQSVYIYLYIMIIMG